ncbi:hypothetical protein SDC9_207491 [bioreactor metagenome]|uniref:Uncharacterized protein n=1 Tax=bioreactor metagenome TaxID=1076179 RepID=A0A645JAL1_9ZZZZ
MNKQAAHKKKIMDEIVANDFAALNGSIIRIMGNVLGPGWQKGSDLMMAFRDKEESELYFSLDYLQQCDAIAVRDAETKEPVEIYDFELEEIQIRLTADGIKLLMVRKKDELIEI